MMKPTGQVNCQLLFENSEKAVCLTGNCVNEDNLSFDFSETEEDGCQIAAVTLKADGQILKAENPVRICVPAEKKPKALTAMYMLNPWWTRPAFISSFEEMPEKTRIAFLKYEDSYGCLLPMIGSEFMTMLTKGTQDSYCFEMTASVAHPADMEECLYVYAEKETLEEAVECVFAWVKKKLGLLSRDERTIPEMLKYLGWCSWDAFYRDVNEEGIRAKADELNEKDIPVKWILIDDGWQKVNDRVLLQYEPDEEKFPDGFLKMTEDIKEKTGVRWFGVWHTLTGYWDGMDEESTLWKNGGKHLMKTADGKILPDPKDAEGFFRTWYEMLKKDGISFTKVDNQSSVTAQFKDTVPIPQAARGLNGALEKAASVFDGSVINCMGMAMESILARPTSAISRNSDDFVPKVENSFREHLLQNAFNSIYHNELYTCDWDMFWTRHSHASQHALIRAISGGPVYFSDRVGETDAQVLKPLCYKDGRLLMMDRSARPTADCVFEDPFKTGVLKLYNTGNCGNQTAGGIALFNLTEEKQEYSFRISDIPEMKQEETCIVYDWLNRKVCDLTKEESCKGILQPGKYAWFILLPEKETACLGLINKYAGFMAAEKAVYEEGKAEFILHESGRTAFVTKKPIASVSVNGNDVTDQLVKNGSLYELDLPEAEGKTSVIITY